MSECTKGKLKFQKTDCTQIGWLKYRICNSEDTRNIALVDNGHNADELVRRWNAFEKGGLMEELRTAREAQKKANDWFGASDTGRKLKYKAAELVRIALAKI